MGFSRSCMAQIHTKKKPCRENESKKQKSGKHLLQEKPGKGMFKLLLNATVFLEVIFILLSV